MIIPSVSIIVPVYNVSRFLRRCLDSCVNQTMKEIEVIVVNDYSPDPLDADIMREYEMNYPNIIKTLWHTSNKKLGAARNTGIMAAHGKYLTFVDSDDFIDLTFCEELYEAAEKENVDYICCDYCEKTDCETKYMDRSVCFNLFSKNGDYFYGFAWGSLVRTQFVKENNLFFPENVFFEDNPVILSYMILTKKLSSYNKALYVYINNNNDSISHKIKGQERIPDVLLAYGKMRQNILETFSKEQLELYDLKSLIEMTDWLIYYEADKIYIDQVRNHFQYIDLAEYISKINERSLRRLMEYVWISPDSKMTISDIIDFADKIKYETITRRLSNMGFLDKRICVWGAGYRGKLISRILLKAGCIFTVVDSDSSKWGMKFCEDSQIASWGEVKSISDVVIVSASGAYETVKKTIGLDSEIDIIIDMKDLCNETEVGLLSR